MSDKTQELVEQLVEWFEKHTETHHLAGWEKRTDRADLIGFKLLNTLVPGQRDIIAAAEHDMIWLSIELEDLAGVASEDDVIALLRCGILYDADRESLYMHV